MNNATATGNLEQRKGGIGKGHDDGGWFNLDNEEQDGTARPHAEQEDTALSSVDKDDDCSSNGRRQQGGVSDRDADMTDRMIDKRHDENQIDLDQQSKSTQSSRKKSMKRRKLNEYT